MIAADSGRGLIDFVYYKTTSISGNFNFGSNFNNIR